ncbi:MAG: 6-phosphogluconolactonase [Desulfobulbaceae bacterium A2]|nr:MAG: 6-phosphogluconolactonase [Desulfobulbaceae bacterium A2]
MPRAVIRHFALLAEASVALAEEIIDLAAAALTARGLCTLALAGGATPRMLYARLAEEGCRQRIDWARLHLFWGDERWVAPDHADSNYRLVRESVLDHVALPAANCHPISTAGSSPQADASRYEREIARFFGQHGLLVAGWPCFDLILLGMGEDGHVASLFPGDPILDEGTRLVAAVYPPAGVCPSVERLTMTLPLINRARSLRLLLAGRPKAELLHTLEESGPAGLPVALLAPREPAVLYLAEETR